MEHTFDKRMSENQIAIGQAIKCLECKQLVVPRPAIVISEEGLADEMWEISKQIARKAGVHPCDVCHGIFPEKVHKCRRS